jgi:hypothetical protein
VTPVQLLHAARAAGLTLEVEADGLAVSPVSRLTADMRAALVAARSEVLALLKAEVPVYVPDPRTCAECGRGDFTVMVATEFGELFCRGCWRKTANSPAAHRPRTPALECGHDPRSAL